MQGNLGGPGEKLDFSAVAKYTRAEEAVRDPDVEAVDICLPTHLHERIAVLAMRCGKHVLVEKPMALDGAAADRMIAEAERHQPHPDGRPGGAVHSGLSDRRGYSALRAARRRCAPPSFAGAARRPPGAPGWRIPRRAAAASSTC